MKFLFIDETEKFGYFGVSVIRMDSSKYGLISNSIYSSLSKRGWDLKEEFKSTHIFSRSGDSKIDIETRKEIAFDIIKSNISQTNARFDAYFAYCQGEKNTQNYKMLLEHILTSIPRQSDRRQDKNLIAVYLDQLDFADRALKNFILTFGILENRGYTIVEHPCFVTSSNDTYGIILADLIAFISMWYVLNQKTLRNDSSIAEVKKMKNEFISKLLEEIKTITIIQTN